MNCEPQNRSDALSSETYVLFRQSILDGVEIKRCKGSPADFKPHVHNELSLGHILAGSTDLTMSGHTIRYQAGDGIIIPPLVSHRCAPHDIHQWEYIMLFIRPGLYENMLRFVNPKKLEGLNALRLTEFISQLLTETEPDTLENILLELLLEFGEDVSPDTPDAGTIEQVRSYIACHLDESIPLAKLETLSGLDKYTLIRSFKKAYVTTPANYHLQCRVAEAKKRLQGNSDVLTLCHDLHFYDQAHLIREFKRMYGITPNAYQKQLNA